VSSPASTEPTSRERPIADLFTNLGHDVLHLPSLENAIVLGAGAAATALAHQADHDIADWAMRSEQSSYTGIGDFLGNGWVQVGGAVTTYAVGLANHSPAATHVGSDLIRGQILNGLATRGLKVAVQRTRPNGGKYSFPSGHSSAMFMSAAVLQAHASPKLWIPAYAAAGFVGYSRIRDGAHWFSDVVAGATLGTIIGRTVVADHGHSRWTVAPAASAEGIVVLVIKR
jgi:membrane-associated phospholipid phosphatase